MKLRKLFLFFLICISYQNVALAQLVLTNSLEAKMTDLNPEILHEREKIEKIRTDSIFGCVHMEIYFDSLGRDTMIAYFGKEDSIPYKRRLYMI